MCSIVFCRLFALPWILYYPKVFDKLKFLTCVFQSVQPDAASPMHVSIVSVLYSRCLSVDTKCSGIYVTSNLLRSNYNKNTNPCNFISTVSKSLFFAAALSLKN